jgi:shikimate dehydrogenase
MTPFISGYTQITGVVGHNIHYTKSPLIHNYWYRQHHIDGVYVCFQTDNDNFETSIKGLFSSGVVGLNITVPFKERAFDMCHVLSPEAKHAKAVNCLVFKDNKITGHNTDGLGFYNALLYLDANINLNGKSVLILGAGGAAASIISYLSQFKVTINVLNRTLDKANILVNRFSDAGNIKVVDKPCISDIIVQTTNVKNIETGNILDISNDIISQTQYIMDINYGKDSSNFLKKPRLMGIKNCDGSEMLLQQASRAFEIFNHKHVIITDSLRTLVQ